MPQAQRSVLILRGQQELNAVEVCRILGISEGNMRVLLRRARLPDQYIQSTHILVTTVHKRPGFRAFAE
ncbi:MAG: hypothetical protein KJ731_05075 [Alphaproteobacteria bacterium]|nr:hypothetical protein [Alphaproteobacteria bacterium]MBU1280202.1 hypothetical protein [Alphaproteobacteria bacterium]MBU1572516.1 hypothetical protein [Alphaproteobacteria bacterium]MBU1827838.1 hypothetical protein [Alphaproteobacteria bacterium]MBU2076801.1 hypothetical protein [Alphaproteobacteria bacterium]